MDSKTSKKHRSRESRHARLGLGIDAGGTYTDAVIYDFIHNRVLRTAKVATTKWDFTVGIKNALDHLGTTHLRKVDLVTISTTLATNAIVEGKGQRVGLLVMPPYGMFEPEDIAHAPLALLDGQMDIDGSEITPINPAQVQQICRRMAARNGVGAFAVCGFASCNNPAHELAVKEIVRHETQLSVTCGHEVSELLNYSVRAQTAALNARIIPRLEKLIDEIGGSLERHDVNAPIMVVKSDGSLMSARMARERPVETILSGPAASVAGAVFLSGSQDAIVVDMGGTTTDSAIIKGGLVSISKEGSKVGNWRTHVRALGMRTLGLGGDSRVAFEQGRITLGPHRVVPVSCLIKECPEGSQAIDWLERNHHRFTHSSQGWDLITINRQGPSMALHRGEADIVRIVSERPYSVHELAQRMDHISWQFLPLRRLEETHLIQRSGLTPTDMLHVTGHLSLWDTGAARRFCRLMARLSDIEMEELASQVLHHVVRNLTVEILKKQLDEEIDSDELERSPAAMALVNNLLKGGSEGYQVNVALRRPIIGIGAPIPYFLPQAGELLGTSVIIPPNAEVANAIGAITSSVFIHKQVRISTFEIDRYVIAGLAGAPSFDSLEEAAQFARGQLDRMVREMALEAGTDATDVEFITDEQKAVASSGESVFLSCTIIARLSGRPDVARLAAAELSSVR
jgi:N-methylhydantoinase A/oxoprolinase/acetone carboxylase beta subunit